MIMKIGIYKSHAKVLRNRGFVVVYNFNKDWDEKVLRNRGLLGGRFFVREAFPHEEAEVKRCHRAVSYSYPDIETLLADERRAGCTEEVIEQIQKLSLTPTHAPTVSTDGSDTRGGSDSQSLNSPPYVEE